MVQSAITSLFHFYITRIQTHIHIYTCTYTLVTSPTETGRHFSFLSHECAHRVKDSDF